MKTRVLTPETVLRGYDRVAALYPHIPSLSMWRAWEAAAYEGHELRGRVLDLGCGDGRYLALLWPELRGAVGVDVDPHMIDAARASGVYDEVLATPAHELPFDGPEFGSVFANCSIEHMDHAGAVLAGAHRCLAPGGTFLLSVVTDRMRAWDLLPLLMARLGAAEAGERYARWYHDEYHHFVNAWSVEGWVARLAGAGFDVAEHVPLLPEVTARLYLALDQLWHVPDGAPPAELGGRIHAWLAGLRDFPAAFRKVLEACLAVETDPATGCGAVFLCRRPAGGRA